MAQILIKRNTSGVPGVPINVPAPGSGGDGELAFAISGFANLPPYPAGGGADLIISAGSMGNARANYTLVGRTRQVELQGAQTIPGRKTFNGGINFGSGTAATPPASLLPGITFFPSWGIGISAGRMNYMGGAHFFTSPDAATDFLSITAGNGIQFQPVGGPYARRVREMADPLLPQDAATKNYVDNAVLGVGPGAIYTFRTGLTETATGNIVDLDPASDIAIGGVRIVQTSGLTITGAGDIALGPASALQLGGVMVTPTTSGLTLSAGGVLALGVATPTQLGGITVPAGSALTLTGPGLGMTVVAAPQIEVGTDNILPVTALGFRSQTGAPVGTLSTTFRTLVPAINEIVQNVAALTGNLQFGGTYDVAANIVRAAPNPINPFPPDVPLPPVSAAHAGWYLICISEGPPVGPYAPMPPSGEYTRGDWIICPANGPPVYVVVEVGGTVVVASNVGISAIPPLSASNVQDALAEIYLLSLQAVAHDASLTGLGTTVSPLTLAIQHDLSLVGLGSAAVGQQLSVGIVDGGQFP
jgi:hypothetical protein